MIFYDFEVFAHNWLVVFNNVTTKTEEIIIDDSEKLLEFYEKNKNEIWVGYNSKYYDQYILKGILLGMDPKKINDEIIVHNKKGWEISSDFNKIKLFNYDVRTRGDPSLKTLEGFMGHNIKESSVNFDIQRELSKEEIEEVVEYCRYDVEQTIEVFLQKRVEFTSHVDISKAITGKLTLKLLNKTKTQLAGIMLDARKKNWEDEFDLFLPTNLELTKYKACAEWYLKSENHRYTKMVTGKSGKKIKVKNQLDVVIAGVPHVLGYGGIHGAIDKYHGKGKFLLMDVAALYPSLMIVYDLLSRSVPEPKKFERIYNKNLELKVQGKKAEREPYKRTCNSTYGAMKDQYNPLYDPRQANNVCVHGQLFLVDLIEKLEPYCEIIQSNTDGILVKYEDEKKIREIAAAWEKRTQLELEYEYFGEVYQKDVNNYIFVNKEYFKTKGGFVKKLNPIDYDLPIINEAIVNYLVHKIPIQKTIYGCTEYKKFQMIRKITNKFEHIKYGDKILNEKCIRLFASKSIKDGGVFQKSVKTGRYGKIKDSPKRCFLDNSNINNKPIPLKLDKEWYVELTKHRLKLFGVKENV